MKILRLDEIHWNKIDESHRRVFVRVDFNVPMNGDQITDDYRIRQAIPTIKYLLDQKCIVVLASHMGRPKADDEASRAKFSLLPVAERLAHLLEHEVIFSEETVGDGVRKLVLDARGGKSVILLENLRFDPREEANDADFAEALFRHTDIYINDAFGASHRAHASIEAITHFAKVKAAGFLLAKEWEVLNQIVHHPSRPQMAVLGGSKIADKILVIENLMQRSAALFIGGRMAQTFMASQGYDLGGSSIEEESLPVAKRLVAEARRLNVPLYFPIDGRAGNVSEGPKGAKKATLVDITKGKALSKELAIFDVGPKTLEAWSAELSKAKSIIWNGPLGVFENPSFAEGTLGLVDYLVSVKDKIPAVVGGGETVSAVTERKALEKLSHVSTGGGAMLEFLEGKALPGFEALKLRDRDIEAKSEFA